MQKQFLRIRFGEEVPRQKKSPGISGAFL